MKEEGERGKATALSFLSHEMSSYKTTLQYHDSKGSQKQWRRSGTSVIEMWTQNSNSSHWLAKSREPMQNRAKNSPKERNRLFFFPSRHCLGSG